MKAKKQNNDFQQYFVSFYKGGAHYVFYSKLVHSIEEVKAYIAETYDQVSDLVLDQVI